MYKLKSVSTKIHFAISLDRYQKFVSQEQCTFLQFPNKFYRDGFYFYKYILKKKDLITHTDLKK